MSAKKELKKNFAKWSEKTGYSVEMLKQMVEDQYEKAAIQWSGLDDEVIWQRVHNIIASQMTAEMKSEAKPWLVHLFSVGERRNLSERNREEQVAAWNDNPDKAIHEGLANSNGVALDTREFYPNTDPPIKNRGYGKPLKDFFQRVSFGVGRARSDGEGTMRFVTIRTRNKQSEIQLPEKKDFMMRLNLRKADDIHANLTSATISRVMIGALPEMEGLSIAGLLDNVAEDLKSGPVGLADWMDTHVGAPFVIIEGDLIGDAVESSNGNISITLGDIAVDIDFEGIQSFFPFSEELKKLGSGSRIKGIGYPSQGVDLEGEPQITFNGNVAAIVYAVEQPEEMFEEESDYDL